MQFQPGETIADYQIVGILGQGGMGAVYRVRNLLSGREEAMKVVLPGSGTDADAAGRFLREIKIQASLQHPNIAALRTAVRAGDNILMIMELVEGESLECMLQRGPLSLAPAVRIADDILGALGYAHERGVVHRDVKPSNILVTARGFPKLMDFGIARAVGDNQLTHSGMAVGSPHYMSPEQVLTRPVDERSDVYSMGATFYEMLTGKRPVDGDGQYAIMNAHLTQIPKAPSTFVPAMGWELSSVVMKSLAKRPEDRYQTAAAFQSGLRQALFGTDSTQTIAMPAVPHVSTVQRLRSPSSPVWKRGSRRGSARSRRLWWRGRLHGTRAWRICAGIWRSRFPAKRTASNSCARSDWFQGRRRLFPPRRRSRMLPRRRTKKHWTQRFGRWPSIWDRWQR